MITIQEIKESFETNHSGMWSMLDRSKKARCVSNEFYRLNFAEKIAAQEKEKRNRIRKEKYHQKMYEIIMNAHRYYSDLVYESAAYGIDGNDQEEIMRAMELGEFDDQSCKAEALWCAYPNRDPQWYEKVLNYWNDQNIF